MDNAHPILSAGELLALPEPTTIREVELQRAMIRRKLRTLTREDRRLRYLLERYEAESRILRWKFNEDLPARKRELEEALAGVDAESSIGEEREDEN